MPRPSLSSTPGALPTPLLPQAPPEEPASVLSANEEAERPLIAAEQAAELGRLWSIGAAEWCWWRGFTALFHIDAALRQEEYAAALWSFSSALVHARAVLATGPQRWGGPPPGASDADGLDYHQWISMPHEALYLPLATGPGGVARPRPSDGRDAGAPAVKVRSMVAVAHTRALAHTEEGKVVAADVVQLGPGAAAASPSKVYEALCMANSVRPNSGALRAFAGPGGAGLGRVERLDFSRTYLGDRGAVPVLQTLAACPLLRELLLDNTGLGNGAVHVLVGVLMQHELLHSLSVNGNPLFETAGMDLLRLLRGSRQILHLSWAGADFSPHLTQRLQRQLQANRRQLRAHPYYSMTVLRPGDVTPASAAVLRGLWSRLAAPPYTEPVELQVGLLMEKWMRRVSEAFTERYRDPAVCAIFACHLDRDAVRENIATAADITFRTSWHLAMSLTVDAICAAGAGQEDNWGQTLQALRRLGELHHSFGVREYHHRDMLHIASQALREVFPGEVSVGSAAEHAWQSAVVLSAKALLPVE
eukprot:TRINITY_DN19104_c0_g1_i1.p1 TRINITY_DN19104_c0_g1~~TRINITY_DN19104_c0_g1_i1.p1  ORF type:complete len:533 (+),score=161.47 TRINITY_DN19104_c0_g1_i1:78-1676(+)